MEVRPPPTSPPLKNSRLGSAAASPYATAPSSPRGRLVVPAAEESAAGGAFLTAPPSPNPFDLLSPPATPRLTGPDPFDMFQHFASSAPASPRRAAAIYAHFAGDDDGDEEEEDEEFQPRGSYDVMGGGSSSVPFEWEERPGTPKRGLGTEAAWDTEFEFGTVAGKAAATAETLTTADELFEKGRIRPWMKPQLKTAAADEPKFRPLKPPPGLLDGGSVTSSPRSPAMGPRGVGMWSPRRRNRVGFGSGVDFDPFAAALLEATKAPAPSPLGGKEANGGGSPAKKVATRPAWRSVGWRRWRLSDLLLFRTSSEGGHVHHKEEPIFKTGEQLDAPPVKKAIAMPAMMIKAIGGKGGDDTGKAKKKQHANRSAAAAAESVAGCARLSPLQRLAKGLGAYTWHAGGRGNGGAGDDQRV